jgi:hypothetical protein
LLSPSDLARLEQLDASQNFDSPEYTSLMMDKLYPHVICRTKPWPNAVGRMFQHLNEDVYVEMQGKSEFSITGDLKNWERWDRLHEIRVKTLTIGARHDELNPEDMKKMASMVHHGNYAYCPNGSHMCMWDDQANYFRQLWPSCALSDAPLRRTTLVNQGSATIVAMPDQEPVYLPYTDRQHDGRRGHSASTRKGQHKGSCLLGHIAASLVLPPRRRDLFLASHGLHRSNPIYGEAREVLGKCKVRIADNPE